MWIRKPSLILYSGLILLMSTSSAQEVVNHNIFVTGAMRETMWNGQLSGLIDLDSLQGRRDQFGLGPLEHLQGEIMLFGDTCFISRVKGTGVPVVEKRFNAKAPFFVRAHVDEWKPFRLPAGVINLEKIEAYLDSITPNHPRPFAFQMTGRILNSTVHIMNLPTGTPVHEPADAHRHQVDYTIENDSVRILGFFSTLHQRIFTHHDTFLHLHLITADGRLMGHVDSLLLHGEEMELKIGF